MTSTASAILGGHYLQETWGSPAYVSPASTSTSTSVSSNKTSSRQPSRQMFNQQLSDAVHQQHTTGSSRRSRGRTSIGNTRERVEQWKHGGARVRSSPAGREFDRKGENHGGKHLSSGGIPVIGKRALVTRASPETPRAKDAVQAPVSDRMNTTAKGGEDIPASVLLLSSPPAAHETLCYSETYPLDRLPFASLQPHQCAAKTFEGPQPFSIAELTSFRGKFKL